MTNDSAPLHRLHLIATPGVEQARLWNGAERAEIDLLLWYSAALQLLSGGQTNIEATLVGGWIGQKDAKGFQFGEP